MNIFRFLGDMMHLASLGFLMWRVYDKKNCSGVSVKTQELYLLVFVARYLDLFLYWISLYNTVMKIAFISSTATLIYLMRFKRPYNTTYDPKSDDFPAWQFLVAPCLILGLIFNFEFTPVEILWSFSIFLEAVAFIPQLAMLRKVREVENLTSNYVFCLGAYRLLYVFNWIYRYYDEGYLSLLMVIPGVVQSILYADFFYYYIIARLKNQKNVTLPI